MVIVVFDKFMKKTTKALVVSKLKKFRKLQKKANAPFQKNSYCKKETLA